MGSLWILSLSLLSIIKKVSDFSISIPKYTKEAEKGKKSKKLSL
jgi:hypothetical protein